MTSWPQAGPRGYLRGVKMTSRHSRRWTCALVVTAAAALISGAASPTLAQAGSPAGDGSAPLLTAPQPAAGWHGQPIRRPLPRREVARTAASPTGVELALGSGYGGSDESGAVRALQRVLLGLGYASGPADGRFGPRTQAAVAWFQIKHGLRPTGVADVATLTAVRRRDGVRSGRPARRPSPASVSAPARRHAATAATRNRSAATTHGSDGMGLLPLVLLLAGGAALAALLSTLAVRRMRRAGLAPRARAQAAARARSVPTTVRRAAAKLKATAAALMPSRPRAKPSAAPAGPSAIGYASGRDAAELERDAAAIEHACSERGWTLASMVREDASVAANGHGAPALSVALDRLASGEASRLVTGRLDHLGRPLASLGRMLEWCAGHGVALVAVDVGLDTSTRDGQLAARCLLAAEHGMSNGATNGASNGAAHRASEPQPRQTAEAGAPGVGRTGPMATRRRRFLR
jgi:peptidoglycan hydrolase-like protein with peptidoglycan-binding domain